MITIREPPEVDHGLYGASAQVLIGQNSATDTIMTLKTPKRARVSGFFLVDHTSSMIAISAASPRRAPMRVTLV